MRAIVKLCHGSHRNIVTVLEHGWLANSTYYYIDMQLCDLNLEQYLYGTSSAPADSNNVPEESRLTTAWDILSQITNGIHHIHKRKVIHRLEAA